MAERSDRLDHVRSIAAFLIAPSPEPIGRNGISTARIPMDLLVNELQTCIGAQRAFDRPSGGPWIGNDDVSMIGGGLRRRKRTSPAFEAPRRGSRG